MTAEQFPSDVPAPKPYECEAPKISRAALYRGWVERLKAMGFINDDKPQPYVRRGPRTAEQPDQASALGPRHVVQAEFSDAASRDAGAATEIGDLPAF